MEREGPCSPCDPDSAEGEDSPPHPLPGGGLLLQSCSFKSEGERQRGQEVPRPRRVRAQVHRAAVSCPGLGPPEEQRLPIQGTPKSLCHYPLCSYHVGHTVSDSHANPKSRWVLGRGFSKQPSVPTPRPSPAADLLLLPLGTQALEDHSPLTERR